MKLTKAEPGSGILQVSTPQREPSAGVKESEALTCRCVGKLSRNPFVVSASGTAEPPKVQLGFSSKAWW